MVNFIVSVLNLLIKALGSVLSFIFGFLPTSPFQAISNSSISEFLGTLNFFIPVSEILSIGQAWLVCVGLFYLYQIVLRWIKAID